PGPPETTASSRTSPTGRGRKPPPPGGGRGAGRAMGINGRESTTARVADGRAAMFSVTWTDCTPPGPWTMGPVGLGGGARTIGRTGGGGAGRAATLATPAGTLLVCGDGILDDSAVRETAGSGRATGSGRRGTAAMGGGAIFSAATGSSTFGAGFCSATTAGAAT